jgi:predicted phage gp36 major capsid-like protein
VRPSLPGDGVNKPKGFLSCTAVADTAWSWGNLGYVATGTAGAFKPGIKPS